MKKVFLVLSAAFIILACNNPNEDKQTTTEPQTKADTLLHEVLEGHDVAMAAQMTKMKKAKEGIQHLIDSISQLPSKASNELSSYKEKLYNTLSDLTYADNAMNKWMNDFNYDSAKDNMEERIKYLTDEKLKVDHVKDAMLSSLQKADSLLKKL